MNKQMSRRSFLAAGALGVAASASGIRTAFAQTSGVIAPQDMVLVNGKIYTMDASKRVVSQLVIRDGRFVAAGNNVAGQAGNLKRIDVKGKTVIPGIIDAHNHIVLVGNRPGWHVLMEDVFTLPDVVKRYQAKAADVPRGEFITTIGP